MTRRAIIGALLFVGIAAGGAAAIAAHGMPASPGKQWAFVDLVRQTQVDGVMLPAGQYMILHDYEKEARGEPCTSLYPVGRVTEGPGEAAVAFHCTAKERPKVDLMTLITETIPGNTGGCTYGWSWLYDRLTEFQFPGDAVAHVVPQGH